MRMSRLFKGSPKASKIKYALKLASKLRSSVRVKNRISVETLDFKPTVDMKQTKLYSANVLIIFLDIIFLDILQAVKKKYFLYEIHWT